MSKSKRKNLQVMQAERLQKSQACLRWITIIATALGLTAGALIWLRPAKSSATPPGIPGAEAWTFKTLLALEPPQLEGLDIGLANLLCAQGLRGSEDLDIGKSLRRLDEMAARVRLETERHRYRFRSNPMDYQNSEPYFNLLMLVTVLQQDFGLIYNPDRVTPVGVFEPNQRFFANSRDVFIHGLLGGAKSGTCASLPALYTAVGRRLHYPLSLVSAKNHLFVRWEDASDRLNFEATSIGLNIYEDAHYQTWPYPMTAEQEKENKFLLSMSAAEECAVFMTIRGQCLMAHARTAEALQAHAQAMRLAPTTQMYAVIYDIGQREAAAINTPARGRSTVTHPNALRNDLVEAPAWAEFQKEQALRSQSRFPADFTDSGLPLPPAFPTEQLNNFPLPTPPQNR